MSKVIREFGTIYITSEGQEDDLDNIWIEEKSFNNLSKFIDENQPESESIFSQGRRSGKPYIKVKSYAGVIETRDGCIIEILPKIHTQQYDTETTTRNVLLKMLCTLQDTPFIQIQEAHLKVKHFTILEVFISTFLQELQALVRKGIRNEYVSIQSNERIWKGKLNINEQIKQNLIKPYQFHVEYDEFQSSTPPNRLIKSCLLKLIKISKSNDNRDKLRHFLHVFEGINPSNNIIEDFAKTQNLNRNYKHYERVIQWAKIFLKNQSFTNFKGTHLNQALLFPMERLFESYVGHIFKKHAPPQYKVSLQDKEHHLVHSHNEKGKFRLKPDIVLRHDLETIVLDCKWKRIDANNQKNNYSIAQSDMYQLFGYGAKYNASKLFLIYPMNEQFREGLLPFNFFKDALPLCVLPFDFDGWGVLDLVLVD